MSYISAATKVGSAGKFENKKYYDIFVFIFNLIRGKYKNVIVFIINYLLVKLTCF